MHDVAFSFFRFHRRRRNRRFCRLDEASNTAADADHHQLPDPHGTGVAALYRERRRVLREVRLWIKAHAEAIKRFYDDKAFAVKAYLAWDKQDQADIERVYDHYSKVNIYERVPYVLAPAVQYILDHPSDGQLGAQLKAFNFHSVIDNSIVARLVKERFFEQLYGPGIKAEEERKAKIAFR